MESYCQLVKEVMLVYLEEVVVRSDLIEEILTKINNDQVIWESPQKLSKYGLLN